MQLPDLEIDRLRQVIDGPWPLIDWPVPPRPPVERFPGLGAGVILDPIGPVALNPQPLPPVALQRMVLSSLNANTMSANVSMPRSALTLPADLQIAVRGGRQSFERAVIANVDLLRPILC